ncbi:MAG: hypothetical protein V2A62_00230 [Candidatus Woesearchaeota archaeon]
MTVINAMKFNDKEGGMVADSQSSTSLRKYEFADKVGSICKGDLYLLLGGSGRTDILGEMRDRLFGFLNSEKGQEIKTARSAADVLSQMMTDYKRKAIEQYLISTYGVSSQAALSGQGIDPKLHQVIMEALTAQSKDAQETFNQWFLMIGKDSTGTSTYFIPMGCLPIFRAEPYTTIGSGSDESDKVLSSFIKGLGRSGRRNVVPLKGMKALIRATNASSEVNQGVGGVPTISYFNEKGITILGEDESRLATEIVRVNDARLIQDELAESCLETLLYQSGHLDEVETQAFKRAEPGYDRIMRFLRGYQ